jgi:hypothetical protein
MTTLTAMLDHDNTCTIFACADCTLLHANGEIEDLGEDFTDQPFPWTEVDNDPSVTLVTMGLLDSGHEWCENPQACRDGYAETGEGCEYIEFSSTPCGGCGSMLAGSRFGFTLWLTYPAPTEWDSRSWWATEVKW